MPQFHLFSRSLVCPGKADGGVTSCPRKGTDHGGDRGGPRTRGEAEPMTGRVEVHLAPHGRETLAAYRPPAKRSRRHPSVSHWKRPRTAGGETATAGPDSMRKSAASGEG